MHIKQQVKVVIDDRERTRAKVTCVESGVSFTIFTDGQRCPSCGQMFNALGQAITHRGY